MNKGKPPLVLIAGPTASGKSALALRLAAERKGVVVNADSMQVYASLRVLTARPNAAEEAQVPHRLFGYVDEAQAWSAAAWAEDAKAVLSGCWQQNRLPILVGGTGLYLRTLLDGIAPVPPIDEQVRVDVRALPVADARAALEREDAAAAARLAPADTARTARALEVIRSTGRSILEWRQERAGGIAGDVTLEPLLLDPAPALLAARIDARVDQMLEQGALAEVEQLAARQLDPTLPAMRAIGVPPLLSHLRGEQTLDQARQAIKLDTRRYAKRQRTWLRHQFPVDWPRVIQA